MRLPLSCLGSGHWRDTQNTNLSQITAFIKTLSRCIIWLHCWTSRDLLIQTNESKTIIFKGSVTGGFQPEIAGCGTFDTKLSFYGGYSTHRNALNMFLLSCSSLKDTLSYCQWMKSTMNWSIRTRIVSVAKVCYSLFACAEKAQLLSSIFEKHNRWVTSCTVWHAPLLPWTQPF